MVIDRCSSPSIMDKYGPMSNANEQCAPSPRCRRAERPRKAISYNGVPWSSAAIKRRDAAAGLDLTWVFKNPRLSARILIALFWVPINWGQCTVMYDIILSSILISSGGCWPMLEGGNRLDLHAARDLPLATRSTNNGTALTPRTHVLSKEVNTTLAFVALLLTGVTYWLLMKYTGKLSSQVFLPSKSLADNLTAVLSLTWPKRLRGSSEAGLHQHQVPWVLFPLNSTNPDMRQIIAPLVHEAVGYNDVEERSFESSGKNSMVPVTVYSPVIRSLIQIAIWNSSSFWLTVVMCVNTVTYNGFASHNITNDSTIRLLLVGIYAMANFGHQYRITRLLYDNFSSALFQACWAILSKGFIFLDREKYRTIEQIPADDLDRLIKKMQSSSETEKIVWTRFDLELLGTTERSDTYGPTRTYLVDKGKIKSLARGTDSKMRRCFLTPKARADSDIDKYLKPLREAEIKVYEKATESALEKVLANVAILLGVCLSTALAPWTSTRTAVEATVAQLGSYALLLSLSTGVLALVSSLTLLANATESGETLLCLQERLIEANASYAKNMDQSTKLSLREKPEFGFSKGISGDSKITPWCLYQSANLFGKILWSFFGSALMLIPRFHRDLESLKNGDTALYFKVEDTLYGHFLYRTKLLDCIFRPSANTSLTSGAIGLATETSQASKESETRE